MHACWCRLYNLDWNKPRYKHQKKLPWIPTEAEINALIAGCGTKTATFLQLLKETAIRYREAWLLKWIDLDFKKETVNITSAKHGIPRELRISQKLIGMLQRLPKNSEKIFGNIGYSTMRNNLNDQKKRIAEKLQNPRIRRITPHVIRHWRASIEYHRGAGLIEIKQMLGHSSLRSTLVYTHLMKHTEKDEYISRATRSVKGAGALIESGFQYVTEMDGLKIFRKRK